MEGNIELAGAVGQVVLAQRGSLKPLSAPTGLTIAIGTYPRGSLSLEVETRLTKAALLYADRVVLYSAIATGLESLDALGRLDDDGVIAFLRQIGPAIGRPEILEACDLYDDLRRRRNRSRQEIVAAAQFKRTLREAVADFAGVAREVMESAGAADLTQAFDAGLVEVDPLITPETEDTDAFGEAYFNKLATLLSDAQIYPLFDDETGDLLRAVVAEGWFELSPGGERRGKQAAIAANFIERMPALPRATMAEVLDVRRELNDPLERFRAGVTRFARLVDSPLLEDDFRAEVEDVYKADVAPALAEIREAFARNAYIKELATLTADEIEKLIGASAVLTLGLAGVAHLPGIAAAAVGTASAAASQAAKAAFNVKSRRNEARQNQVFFLYSTNESLSR
jgi:hypothetical protein